MARKFRGEGHYKVDSKGRVSIPAHFRRVIEASDPDWRQGQPANMVIVYGTDRQKHLECYTMEAIEEVDAKISELPLGSPKREALEHVFTGLAQPASIDETGRLVLPARLRQKIGIENEAYFIAAGDRFRIWKPETYRERFGSEAERLLESLPEGADPLSLLAMDEGA